MGPHTRICLVIYTSIWFIYAGIMTYDRGRRAGLISLPAGRPISTLPARARRVDIGRPGFGTAYISPPKVENKKCKVE